MVSSQVFSQNIKQVIMWLCNVRTVGWFWQYCPPSEYSVVFSWRSTNSYIFLVGWTWWSQAVRLFRVSEWWFKVHHYPCTVQVWPLCPLSWSAAVHFSTCLVCITHHQSILTSPVASLCMLSKCSWIEVSFSLTFSEHELYHFSLFQLHISVCHF
jgi:hypothetical protein